MVSCSCRRWLALATALISAALLQACAVLPQRPFMKAQHPDARCKSASADAVRATPELGPKGAYTLHFVEFDDQGWAFPDSTDPALGDGTPSHQIDCAIADLRHSLQSEHRNLLLFVYVHGWKHSAANDDSDVRKFRELLATRSALFPGRKVVGIYVGWQGNTIDAWGIRNLTFWGRKNAATHVAEGRVRELFSRIRGLRNHWNGPTAGNEHACDWKPNGQQDGCRLRTVMIGHSFGGLILFNSVAPYVIEALTIGRDRPDGAPPQLTERARSIADLIVLLNPAFEGSRYEPVFEASRHYASSEGEPPLLVMITSTADLATKNAFPAARWINSLFQYPSSSDEQSTAMRRTPGHIERLLTHKLCLGEADCADASADADSAAQTPLAWGPALRRYCHGLVLRGFESKAQPLRPIVWNVRTQGNIIAGHNDINGPHVINFVSQIFNDVTGVGTGACLDPETASSAADGSDRPAP